MQMFCLLMGSFAFFLIVGPQVLEPSNIAWLSQGDPAYNYLGWAFFRNTHWTFPLGLNPNYGLEINSSIIYSDSNPLLAFLLKPFSQWLPATFQYFGIWILICFLLQAWFSWKLLGFFSKNGIVRLLGVGFFIFFPLC